MKKRDFENFVRKVWNKCNELAHEGLDCETFCNVYNDFEYYEDFDVDNLFTIRDDVVADFKNVVLSRPNGFYDPIETYAVLSDILDNMEI